MKIALLLPITLSSFSEYFPGKKMPKGYPYPLFVPLVKKYINDGHEVIVCTYDRNLLKSQTFESEKLTIFVAAGCWKPKVSALLDFKYESAQIKKFLKSNPCDIYHAHWTYEFAIAALKVSPEKTVITVHDWAPYIFKIYNDYFRYKKLKISNKVYSLGKHFTTVSPYMGDIVNREYPQITVKVIPNFLSLNSKYIAKHKNMNESPIVVAINNGFDERKNTKNLLLSFEKVLQTIPKAKLYMIGKGYEPDGEANKWANDNNVTKNVFFIGSLPYDKVLEHLHRADILLHTSREESFGMIFLEAMMCNTAIVAGKHSGAAPWILEEGKSGMLVDVDDTESTSLGIIKILNSKMLWENFIGNGITRVKDFELNVIAKQYLEFYNSILSKC